MHPKPGPPLATARLDGVDVLRGLSIAAVVLLHISLRMRIAGFSFEPAMPAWLFHFLFRNGGNGVTVFFAVSGFLIATTSIRRFGSLGHMRPGRFYRIRFARIAPLLLLLLSILSILHLANANGFRISPQKATLPRALLAVLTFHLNWLEATRGYLPPNWDVLWSLSIEEMFYLLFPLVCALLLRARRGAPLFIAILLAFAVAGPFQKTIWTANEIWREKSYLGGMDGIALGCLCALLTDWLRRTRGRQWSRWSVRTAALALTGVAIMSIIALWPHWQWLQFLGRHALDDTLLSLGTCLVVMTTTLTGISGSLFTAPVRWLGRHSYEVYLTHEFAVVWGTLLYAKYRSGPLPIWFVAIALVSLLPGALLARYFSEPLNRQLRGAAIEASPASTAEPALAEQLT